MVSICYDFLCIRLVFEYPVVLDTLLCLPNGDGWKLNETKGIPLPLKESQTVNVEKGVLL